MSRTLLATIAVLLLIVVTGGLLWLAITSDNAVSALLSYAAGLSMIFLPCTLPLVFVIVPLAAKQDKPSKGLALALVFGLGLAMTIAVYGIVTALLGAIAWALTAWIPLVGSLVALVAWIWVIKWRYPGGWVEAAIIGVGAWASALLILAALNALFGLGIGAFGVPGL